ncbi:YqaE/Pmp3 family membrane protein [Fimbriiglobus ruber]|uniref:YqaE/Pmp3 family membrane protein n=1 Tax=Fimbriiglobus ruber TaxID=1908690 RepID=A0A225D354_9BACT|nr:YqaE/Pmp3 family membrane protein [Fimbriiglobus ruber]OWK36021.1 hypothetical protein FRUB_08584 [Fimbriiglobus ruber]
MLTLVALVCPPLAVSLAGRPSQAAKNIILTAFFYVPGLLHALAVLEKYNIERRNHSLLQAVAGYYA